MGVSLVFEYHATVKEVESKFEIAGASLLGNYSVDSLPYKPTNGFGLAIPTNYVLHHSHFPQSSFSIAPMGHFANSPMATTDRGFDLILTKLSTGLRPDQAGKFELTGHTYKLKDFILRIGTASQGTSVKGTVVEVEYEPSEMAYQAKNLLKEFISTVFPDPETIKTSRVLNNDALETYTPIETLYQYLRIFMVMRQRTINGA